MFAPGLLRTTLGIINLLQTGKEKHSAVKGPAERRCSDLTLCILVVTLRCSSRCSVVARRGRRACRSGGGVLVLKQECPPRRECHTVPHRDGTIQSLGSLSVKAIKLQARG